MSQAKIKPLSAALVLDFRCDGCGKKLDCIIVAHPKVVKQIAKSFCESCWEKSTLAPQTSRLVGVN
jgi:hypothetical protein